MVFSQFLGLFSQASVRYLDTSLVGSIQTQITWAGAEVLIARGDQNGLGNGHTANEQALIAQHTPNYTPTYTITHSLTHLHTLTHTH